MPTLKPLGTLLNAPDYADRVNLIKKIKTASGWRFASVVPEANGRLKDRVRINGQLEVHPEGAYYIEWRVGGRSGRRYRTAVAKDEAIDQARRKAIELRAIRDGLIAGPEPEPEVAPKTTIGDAIDAYLRYVKMQRKPRTHLTYRYTLDTLLRAAYKKKYRRGRDPRRRARLHDLLLRAGAGRSDRLRQGRDRAAALQKAWAHAA